jgi:hypothetical protein
VLCDGDGKAQGLWMMYSTQNDKSNNVRVITGFPISLIKPTLKSLKNKEIPKLYDLDVELRTMRMARAKDLGLSDEWVKKVESIPNSKHRLLHIVNILDSTSPSGKLLQVGDIVLSINGNAVTRMTDLPMAFHYSEEVDMVKSFFFFFYNFYFKFNKSPNKKF